MDPDRFDALVARLMRIQSRRFAIKGILAGAVAAAGSDDDGVARKRRNKRGREGRDGRKRGGGIAGPAGRSRRKRQKRLRKRRRDRRDESNARAGKNKKQDRCKKNGKACVEHKRCCSNYCHGESGTCAKRPAP